MAHKITRRDFLKAGVLGGAAAVLAGCQKPRRWVTLEPYVRPPEEQLAGVATWYASACRQCPAGCGILARVMNGRALKLEGNPEHPLNQGKLCARGQAGLQVLYDPDRLEGPVRQVDRGSRAYARISWNEGINHLAQALADAGSQVAIWLGTTTSGHLVDLFQRYAAAVGAPDPLVWDPYSSLNGLALQEAAGQALSGKAGLPYYEVGAADVILAFGANFLGPGLSAVRYGIEFGRFRSQPLGARGYLAVLEPRLSITGVKADRWLGVRPGSEGLAAAALARIIADDQLGPPELSARAAALAPQVDVSAAAAACDVPAEDLARLARIFAGAQHPLAIPGEGLAGVPDGAQALAAVQALNLIAGGGMGVSAPLPALELARPRPSPFPDVLALVEDMRAGKVKALLVHGANPVYDLPGGVDFAAALSAVPVVISFAPLVDETAARADLVLPDPTPLEAWGYTLVAPNFGTPAVSSQQPVVPPAFDTRATGDVLLAASRLLPAAAKSLPWNDEVAFIRDAVARLPSGAAGGSGAEVLWARYLQHGGWWPAAPAAPTALTQPAAQATLAAPAYQGDEGQYPFHLLIVTSDLLGDGRGASQPWLQGSPDPMTTVAWQTWVEIHPTTAAGLGVRDGDLVRLDSPFGQAEALVYTHAAIRPDTVAIPTGQGHSDLGRYARGRGSNPMRLVGKAIDATGSELAWSNLRVKVTPLGRRANLATFEYKPGVEEGFSNAPFPGQ